jgi:hypothetical protein
MEILNNNKILGDNKYRFTSISFEEYQGEYGINASKLKQLLQYSPKQLTLPTVQTESQRIGSAFHSYKIGRASCRERV